MIQLDVAVATGAGEVGGTRGFRGKEPRALRRRPDERGVVDHRPRRAGCRGVPPRADVELRDGGVDGAVERALHLGGARAARRSGRQLAGEVEESGPRPTGSRWSGSGNSGKKLESCQLCSNKTCLVLYTVRIWDFNVFRPVCLCFYF